jgi:hypothetical protein
VATSDASSATKASPCSGQSPLRFLDGCGTRGGGFQAQGPGRARLQGNLVSAKLDTVFRFGAADFKFSPGPLPASDRR